MGTGTSHVPIHRGNCGKDWPSPVLLNPYEISRNLVS